MTDPPMSPRERDEFERIRRIAQIEKDRNFLEQYDEGMAFYRSRIEDNRYELGRIDERLGDGP